MRILRKTFPGDHPTLAAGDVHVWYTRLEPCPAGVAEHLCPDEWNLAASYKLPRVRDQFVAGRGVLRELLGGYLGQSPRAVDLGVDPNGKPLIRHVPLQFNVSHSAGAGLVAVSTVPVGVDLEPVRVIDNAGGLVSRFFAPEERVAYESVPEREKPMAFLRAWTCKEAVLKGLGIGMRRVDECVVELHLDKPARVLRLGERTNSGWMVETWTPCEGFLAAVAYQKTPGAVV